MDEGLSRRSIAARRAPLCVLLACACAIALLGAAQASAVSAAAGGSNASQVTTLTGSSGVSATLEECVTAVTQSERAATFSGEMTAIPGTVRMAIRIEVEERVPGEAAFHAVTASGLGVWRSADPRVKTYKYLKQVTNLSSPASYRGFVQFRWIGDKGHTIKRAERMTAKCLQPAAPVETAPAPSEGGSTVGSGRSVPPVTG
jgi:hypothetical protein